MIKLLSLPLLLLSMAAMACSETTGHPKEPEITQPDDNQGEKPDGGVKGRYLVLYCSRSGNTEQMAQTIGTALGCDIVKVEPQTPYESDYNAMLKRSQQEQHAIENGDYPPIKTSVDNLEDYDVVFVGYPIWYEHMATPIQTFLHNHSGKLSGKRIALFASSGSSGITTSLSDARRHCPNATFTETLLLTSGTLSQTTTRVEDWLKQIGVSSDDKPDSNSLKMKITIGHQVVTATMADNATARDFLSRLPLEVSLQDYARTEKIFYPDPKLTTSGVSKGHNTSAGDITLYVPWGNIAIFYKNFGYGSDLINLGRIDGDGIRVLNVSGAVSVKFERQ